MKPKQSSPSRSEPGINDFALSTKSDKEGINTININPHPPEVKEGL